jgi:putative endonuclease
VLVARDYSFWVYIIGTVHDRVLYIGVTNSLSRRVSEHRNGGIKGFATQYRCRKLLYYEQYDDVRDAIARETQLKKWSRTKKEALITKLNPDRSDLGPFVLDEISEMSRLRST